MSGFAPSQEPYPVSTLADRFAAGVVRVWKVLTVASVGFAAADINGTIHSLHRGGYEADPLARPLTNLPAPAHTTLGMMGAAGVDLLGLKLQTSGHAWIRRCWWVPQVLQISGNLVGVTDSARH